MIKIKTALISVSDKSNLAQLLIQLKKHDVEIYSTGGTYNFIKENGYAVKTVKDLTNAPEILGGRVKSLHPNVHGGILARRDLEADKKDLLEHKIKEIDLVVCNLYPFKETILKTHSWPVIIENIDIGGPTMIRAAAKNHKFVGILTENDDYQKLIDDLVENNGSLTQKLRKYLAMRAFNHTASYDSYISRAFNDQFDELPERLSLTFKKVKNMRYGENPHQNAAYYIDELNEPKLEQLNGKKISYNNINDTTSALECAFSMGENGVAIIKHTNPCGAAAGNSVVDNFIHAKNTDSLSAYGGIVAINGIVTAELAEAISESFFEIVAARSFEKSALEKLKLKKNLILLSTGFFTEKREKFNLRSVYGGLLYQDKDSLQINEESLKAVTELQINNDDKAGLFFAWRIAMLVKSNAIILSSKNQTLGIGAGQMSRIDSLKIAIMKAENAKLDLKGCFLASDAFFPFSDSIEIAHEIGVRAIIQPGGSKRDSEVIAVCNKLKIAMVFTGYRHFKH